MKSRNSLNTHSVRTNIILIGFDIYNFDTLLYLIIRNRNLKFVFYNAIMISLIRILEDFYVSDWLIFTHTFIPAHPFVILEKTLLINTQEITSRTSLSIKTIRIHFHFKTAYLNKFVFFIFDVDDYADEIWKLIPRIKLMVGSKIFLDSLEI